MAAAYGSRPSAILGVEDSWSAYQLDLCCLTLGRQVEGLISGPEKERLTIEQALALTDDGAPLGGVYRDPSMYVKRKVAIPESGVW